MRASSLAHEVERAKSPRPVEGESEIDVIVESNRYLIFLEAKLGSDINARTTCDPARNQIARNIDCLIESTGDREPVFWMLVRDVEADRAYVQQIERYRSEPGTLHRDLPHRDPARLTTADPHSEAVRCELLRRI